MKADDELPPGGIETCAGKNHAQVKPRDDLDGVKPQANRVVNQLFGCFRHGGIGATTRSIAQRQQDGCILSYTEDAFQRSAEALSLNLAERRGRKKRSLSSI